MMKETSTVKTTTTKYLMRLSNTIKNLVLNTKEKNEISVSLNTLHLIQCSGNWNRRISFKTTKLYTKH